MIIGVTGLNAASEPEAGFGVLQSLKDNGKEKHQLIGLAYKPLDTGLFHTGLMDKAFIVPSPDMHREDFLQRIQEINDESGLNVIIPTLHEEVSLFIDMEPRLRAAGIAMLLPEAKSLRELRVEHNKYLKSRENLTAKENKEDPPALIKNPVSEPMVTEADAAEHFATTVIADKKSKIVAIASVKKILRSRYGGTWMALTVDNDEFIRLAKEIVKTTSWQGVLTIEVTRNHRGNQFVSGFYPTFPDWINLAGAAGANLPTIFVNVVRGEKLKSIVQTVSGKLLVRSSIDVVTDLKHFSNISLNGEIVYDQE